MAKAGPKTETTVRLVYCGPNIPNLGLQQFTVFKDALPVHLIETLAKCPAINLLCVATNQLQTTRSAIGTKGSAANVAYGQVVNFIKQGGK